MALETSTMILIEPRVIKLAETHVDRKALESLLKELGGGASEWWAKKGQAWKSDSELLIEVAGRTCYESFGTGLNPNITKVRIDSEDYYRNVLEKADGSIFEHSTVTFALLWVSRVFTHELIRHRVGTAYSQESLRYVRINEIKMPAWSASVPAESLSADMLRKMSDAVNDLEARYNEIVKDVNWDNLPFDQKKRITSALRRMLPQRKLCNMTTSKDDDVRVTWPRTGLGPPILFTNIDIRRMLRLAKAGPQDVFYDLGCGWAQNLIIAATEFKVKKCVGVERDKRRYHKAVRRVKARNLSSKIRIIRGNFEDMIDGVLTDEDIREATIVFYGLSTSADFLERLSDQMRKHARLVYYYNTLFPEIKADAMDYPFYISKHPFTRPVSERDWLASIIGKEQSSLNHGRKPSTSELWDELTHDYDYWGLRGEVAGYRARLRRLLRRTT